MRELPAFLRHPRGDSAVTPGSEHDLGIVGMCVE